MSAPCKLSVILPCYNSGHTIATQLDALVRQECADPWEVLVADNGSTDDTTAVIQRYAGALPNLRIIDAAKRRGSSYARNAAVRAACGDALAFCDADDEVAPGWVAAIGRALEKHDCVACRIDIEKLNPAWIRKAYGAHPQDHGLQRAWYNPHLFHGGGGSMGVRRAAHEKIGGFDESLLRMQDTDYCYRLQLAGYHLHFVADTTVHIRLRDSFPQIFRQSRLWGLQNILLHRRYRTTAGLEWHAWEHFAWSWIDILTRAVRIRSRGDCANVLRRLGWQIGRLEGVLRFGGPPI